MAAGPIVFWQDAGKFLFDGTIDLDTAVIKLALFASSMTPNVDTQNKLADISGQLATANGYTSGGALLASKAVTRAGASATSKFDADDVVWTASGGAITARYGVLYVLGTVNTIVNPLIGYFLLDSTPADVSATDGNTLTVQWAAGGIATITV